MGDRLAGKVAFVRGIGAVGPGWGNGKATATLFRPTSSGSCSTSWISTAPGSPRS